MSNRKRAEKVNYASSIRSFFQIVTNPLSFLTLKYHVASKTLQHYKTSYRLYTDEYEYTTEKEVTKL